MAHCQLRRGIVADHGFLTNLLLSCFLGFLELVAAVGLEPTT